MDRTKTEQKTPTLAFGYSGDNSFVEVWKGQTASNSITYGLGPKYVNGRMSWKPCVHSRFNDCSGILYDGTWKATWQPKYSRRACTTPGGSSPTFASGTIPSLDSSALWQQFHDSLDLNCKDSVLAYSTIVQLFPLGGQLLRANHILRKVAKQLSRDMRRKPFATVIKSAISLDFINRFVVQTTLDDLHKVATSMDYVLSVIDRARAREASPTAYKFDQYTERVAFDRTRTYSDAGANVKGTLREKRLAFRRQQLHVLALAKYNLSEVSPLLLWANRVGLTKPLGSMWDLIPFSFVVDYFFRAGEFIDTLENQYTSIDGLVGKVQSIEGAWLTEKSGYQTSYDFTLTGQYYTFKTDNLRLAGGHSDWYRTTFSRMPATYQEFSRAGLLDEKWGQFTPSLSATRKRTLLQLYLQYKLR